jgi:hypothetical protein
MFAVLFFGSRIVIGTGVHVVCFVSLLGLAYLSFVT